MSLPTQARRLLATALVLSLIPVYGLADDDPLAELENLLSGEVCANDLDGDGYFDGEGEVVACVNGVCPHDAAVCEATYGTVECPSGYSFSAARDRCERAPVCPSGTTYDSSSKKCEDNTTYPASYGGNGNSYGAVFGFEVEDGKIRIVYRPTSLYGNWAALGTGSQKSTVTYYSYTECYYCDSNGTVCDTDYRNMSIETHGGTDFRIVQEGSSWSRATPWFTIGLDNDGFGHQRINYSSDWIGLSVSGNSLRLHDTWSGNIYAGAWVAIGFYCPNGGTLSGTDCVISVTHDPTCPEGGSFEPDNNVCQAALSCSEGTYRSDLKACYVGHITCPLGDHPCAVIDGSGVNKCSALACVDASDSVNMEDAESDLTAYEDDGSIDPDTGECSGVFKIFNGRPGECLPSGVKTWFFNCCNPNPSSWLIFQKSCPDSSLTTAQAIQAQTTHYIGTYCKTRIPIIGCIQRARVYCIFNSKLARIVHQQGREQLHKFAPDGRWGSAQSPNCEGFTPEEFQVLDFSKIDLGEFFGDIDPLDTPALQQKTQDAIINFQDSLR